MSRCLCCGKELHAATANEWHQSCIESFFGVNEFPEIDISNDILNKIAIDSTSKGFTVPGVQKKLSLHLSKDSSPRLTVVNYPTGYILKPQTDEYEALPEMEYLIMQMAKESEINTVEFALIRLKSQKNSLAYITKRIDRKNGQMLAMEDFCQLECRLTEDKYKGSYERCAKVIENYSQNINEDKSELFKRIVFSFAVGNSDMHLKNFSLIEDYEGSCRYSLSAAYDMLSTNVVIPEDNEQFALTINGKKLNIRRKDFLVFADTAGIDKAIADEIITKIVKLKDRYISMCNQSNLPDELKERLKKLIDQRIAGLQK